MLESKKEEFLKNEFWLLSFNAAFQRNRIYTENTSDKEKRAFRNELKMYISNNILPLYNKQIKEEHHNSFLVSIVSISKSHGRILNNGQLNIGTAQKLLNLVLKYYWCAGLIDEPIDFPIDRIIQKHIPAKSRKNWTDINSIKDYMTVIKAAKKELGKGETLAQWELKNYKRN